MRPIALAVFVVVAGGTTLLTTGCGSPEKTPEQQRAEVFMKAESASGPSASVDFEQLEAWSGKYITLVGRFEHLNFKHGIIVLPSGLKVYIPHFDQHLQGDDWFKYLGKRCYASGI